MGPQSFRERMGGETGNLMQFITTFPAEDSPQMVVKSKGVLRQNGRKNHSG